MESRRFLLKELSRYRIGTYGDIIYRNALLYPDDEAFKCGSMTLTFSQFNQEVNRLIRALNGLGIEKGDVIGLLSWNRLESALVYGAAMKGGFIASPYNPRLKSNELDYLINYSEAKALFVGPELVPLTDDLRDRLPRVRAFVSLQENGTPGMEPFRALLDASPDTEPEVDVEEADPVFIFYTSGTTGIPRGALYTQHRAMEDTQRCVISQAMERRERNLQIMPLFHVGGTKHFWAYYFIGSSNVIMPQISFDPAATLRALEEEKATDIHIVPTHLAAFLALPDVDQYDLGGLRSMFYAASPMPVELLRRGMEKWGPIFAQGYGSSETGPYAVILSKDQHNVLDRPHEEQVMLASAGFPHIGVHIRVVDEQGIDLPPGDVGEIIVKSKSIMQEYWKRPEDTRATVVDGWVHTGDMGRYDEQGYIYVVDRKKDMIISGGENVFPREIEEVLYGHPAVLEAAVIGIPDDYWVERVHAVIVLKKGKQATAEDIITHCKEKLAGYKAPKSVEFAASLPKSPAGKILKRELREAFKKNNIGG